MFYSTTKLELKQSNKKDTSHFPHSTRIIIRFNKFLAKLISHCSLIN